MVFKYDAIFQSTGYFACNSDDYLLVKVFSIQRDALCFVPKPNCPKEARQLIYKVIEQNAATHHGL